VSDLQDLRSRLDEKAKALSLMASLAATSGEALRLGGKSEGVRLAISFVDEAIRGQPTSDADAIRISMEHFKEHHPDLHEMFLSEQIMPTTRDQMIATHAAKHMAGEEHL
jgi:hypothetical protein